MYCMYHLMCCDCPLPQDKGDYAGALSLTGEVLMVCGTSITPQTMQVRMFACVVSVQLSIESLCREMNGSLAFCPQFCVCQCC